MYRPEGWKNIYKILYESTKDTETELAIQAGMQGLAYEAGADAIVTYLLSQEHQDWLSTAEGKAAPGRWVFIPEDE